MGLGRPGGGGGAGVKKRPWTPLELEVLRRDWQPGKNNSLLAARLGRSETAVKGRASWLGLTKPNGFKHWSPWDDERLRDMVGRLPPEQVAKRLGRSVTSVKARAGRIGASWRDRDNWYTAQEVSEILGFGPQWVGKRIRDGTLAASYAGGSESDGKKHHVWRIERSDLRAFLRRHPHELVGRNVDVVQIVEILAGLDHGVGGDK